MENTVVNWIDESIQTKTEISSDLKLIRAIVDAADIVFDCLTSKNGIVYVCGNGGSAGDAGHFVGELMNRFSTSRDRPLGAVDLSSQTSTITAIANDYSYDKVFSKQIEGLGKQDDVLLAISTSGKSVNILNAVNTALRKKMRVIFLTGGSRANSVTYAKNYINLALPSSNTPIVQESHIMILHIICRLIDDMYADAWREYERNINMSDNEE